METTEKNIPNYVFEDLLFQRRLQRDLNTELERLNKLLAEQVELLQKREVASAKIYATLMLRWESEEESVSPNPNEATQ
jgi:hypothetical protein